MKFNGSAPSVALVATASSTDISKTEVSGPSPPSAVEVSPSGDRDAVAAANAAMSAASVASGTM